MSETVAQRVARGAEWLDEQRPGWWKQVDLGRLDMADECLCVLGQVFAEMSHCGYGSGFGYALDRLHVPHVDGGFDISHGASEFAELGTAWKRLIAARRSVS